MVALIFGIQRAVTGQFVKETTLSLQVVIPKAAKRVEFRSTGALSVRRRRGYVEFFSRFAGGATTRAAIALIALMSSKRWLIATEANSSLSAAFRTCSIFFCDCANAIRWLAKFRRFCNRFCFFSVKWGEYLWPFTAELP